MLLCLKEGEDFLHPTKPFPPTGPGQKERDLAQGPQTGWWRSPRHTSPVSNPELPLLLPFPVPPGPTHWLLNWLFVSLDSAGKIEADSKILTVCFPWGPFNFKCESTLEASRTFLRMPKLFLRPRGVKDSYRGGLHWSQLCPPPPPAATPGDKYLWQLAFVYLLCAIHVTYLFGWICIPRPPQNL